MSWQCHPWSDHDGESSESRNGLIDHSIMILPNFFSLISSVHLQNLVLASGILLSRRFISWIISTASIQLIGLQVFIAGNAEGPQNLGKQIKCLTKQREGN